MIMAKDTMIWQTLNLVVAGMVFRRPGALLL
jgi:hypothetical protein